VPIIRSSSKTNINSGPLEVLPGLEHSGTSKKKYPYLPYHSSGPRVPPRTRD
jgi:hypothetical protein